MENKYRAFSLVELIVVITLLAILGTIGYINLQGYTSQSRDSKRINELSKIRNGLNIYEARNSVLPIPSEQRVVIGSGTTNLIIQGYVGESVLREIRMFGDVKDPVDNYYYFYSTNGSLTKFQLLSFLENELNSSTYNNFNIIPTANASYEKRYPYTQGNDIGILLDEETDYPINNLTSGYIDLSNDDTYYKILFLDESNQQVLAGSDLYNEILSKGVTETIIVDSPGNDGDVHDLSTEIENYAKWATGIERDTPTIYVSVNGSNVTGDGTPLNPYATPQFAINKSTHGDVIYIGPGTYQIGTYTTDSSGNNLYIGLNLGGKNIKIYGDTINTVLDFKGYTSTSHDKRNHLVGGTGNSSEIFNLTFIFNTSGGTHIWADAANSIFRWYQGSFVNNYVRTTKTASFIHYNSGPSNQPLVLNNVFRLQSRYSTDYSGNPYYASNLFSHTPINGTKVSNRTRTVNVSLDLSPDIPSDLLNVGSTIHTNPDGTRAHIGVYGGKYPWFWEE